MGHLSFMKRLFGLASFLAIQGVQFIFVQMNLNWLLLVLFGLLVSDADAQSSALRDFEKLKEQRDKAIQAATQPVQEKYLAALETLLQNAIRSGDVDGAAKLKAEFEAAQGTMTPAFVIGVWKIARPDGGRTVYIIEPEGKAYFIGGDGKSYSNVWKIEGRKLIIGPPGDDGRFTGTFVVDGAGMKGDGNSRDVKATKAP